MSNFIQKVFLSCKLFSCEQKQRPEFHSHSLFKNSDFRLEIFNDFFSHNSLLGWNNEKIFIYTYVPNLNLLYHKE